MALLSIKRDVDIVPGVSAPVVFHVSQNDVGTNVILSLLNYGTAYNIPQDTTVTIIGSASNGNVFNPVNATYSGSDVTFRLSEEMSSVAGPALCEAVLVLDDNALGTANFIINVEASPMGADVPPVFTDAAWDWMLGKFDSEIIPEFNASLIDAIDSKLDMVFPTDLSGKYLKINSTGHVEASDIEEIPVDATLSHEGEAADAKATGDALALKANESTIAPEFDTSTSYTAGQYVYKNGVLYRFTADHTAGAWTGTDAVVVTIGSALTDLKTDFNYFVKDKYKYITPENWFDDSTITMGKLLADGTVQASTTQYYTDFIPVSGWTRARFFRGDNLSSIYRRNVTCYDTNKMVMTGGSDSSGTTFLIPANVSYIRLTFDYSGTVTPFTMVTNDITPIKYSAYFPPKWIIVNDFLTEESKTALNELKNKEINSSDFANNYACSLPVTPFRQTVGIEEQFYLRTARTPDETTFLDMSVGLDYATRNKSGVLCENAVAFSSVNGFYWRLYDYAFTQINSFVGAGSGAPRRFINENLNDCSLLAIGDSTVDHDVMTQKLLDYFTSKSKSITLLGTLGSDGNYNEGRAGWKATDYLTNRTYNGVVNPFYNPTTETFDFAYYMSNQEYTTPDFVIIQLGINDLGDNTQTYSNIWTAIKVMIDSIRSYNASIKIILNLPTTPTANQDNISAWLPRYKNRVVNYDKYAQEHALSEYGDSVVRCSYCHLILDPETEIRDNVHPTNTGYEKMAMEVINQINCWQNEV